MQYTFNLLITKVLQRLDDPSEDAFTRSQAGDLVNDAYQDVINEIDELPNVNVGNTEGARVAIAPVTGQREYKLGSYRKIIQVQDDSAGGTNPPLVEIVQYGIKDDYRRRAGVYLFRHPTSGAWFIGMCAMEPIFTALLVSVLPLVKKLGDQDVPIQVPDAYHEAIWAGAVMLGKLEESRDATGAASVYEHFLNRLRKGMTGQINPFRSTRLFT